MALVGQNPRSTNAFAHWRAATGPQAAKGSWGRTYIIFEFKDSFLFSIYFWFNCLFVFFFFNNCL